MDLSSSLQRLSAHRPQPPRKAQETLDSGLPLLDSGKYARMGDEGWEAVEKLALAALDVGKIDVADRCLRALADKFPGSPRVECLTGMRMEATESPETCLKYYDDLLESDPANAAAWRRKAAVYRRMGKLDRAVEELSAMLDTFYADVEGWLELADIYSSCHQYTHALQSLSHALLLAPQNPFYFLQFAETAYLAADIPLATKMFLTAIDMTDDDDADVPLRDTIPTGITLRAWYGVKLCTHKFITDPRAASASASDTPGPSAATLSQLDDLSRERLRTAYLNLKNESPPVADTEFMSVVATIMQ
ncbi:TPR-like protein [Obba rivulosa]|uniref:ER membrane protein complex subunit 2 n=1 Tax=Obba rivulosa TaxID=1052685 RepID=A0A8E2DS24_9APHY|nr:TPR-like protein [Obba rivulosa]